MNPSKKYIINHITTIEDIEKIRSVWESMQTHPNSDIDHYLNLIVTRTNIIKPYIFLITSDNNPVTLVIGRIEKFPFELKVGYKKIYCPVIKSLTVIYGGILGDSSGQICKIIYTEIMQLLAIGEADLLRFNYIETDSELYKLVSSRPGMFNRDLFPVTNKHWRMTIPSTLDDFYKSRSSKHRHWLKRMERLLMKDFPDEVKYCCYKSDKELEKVFADLEYIAQNTYQRRIGVGFSDKAETRKTYTNLAQKQRLRTYILYIQNKPCAFWIGELYGNTFHLFSTGYDPELNKYELGTILFIKMIEDLCSIGDVKYLDFGFGDAAYKSRFGNANNTEAIINIFSNRFRSLKISILRIIIVGSQEYAKNILKRFDLLEKIKRKWQHRRVTLLSQL